MKISTSMIRPVIEDSQYGLRLLRKSPAFTTVAVLTLALGIGANSAIYTLLEQVLWRSLPVREPTRLAVLRFTGRDNGSLYSRGDNSTYFSYPMYRDLRDRNSVFSGVIATSWAQVGIQWHNQPDFADAELVSGNYFDVLGVKPALGRVFVQADDAAQNANPVVVLSFRYWQERFGLDPQILNQSLSINGHPFTVIGITSHGFHSVVGGDNPAIFVPMMMKPEITPGWNDLEERQSRWLNVVARLKPELSREKAQAGMDPLWRSLRADELKQMGNMSQSFQDEFVADSHLFLDDGSKGIPLYGKVPSTLLVVMGMAVVIVLIACANIASLLLVRVAHRTREISVRYALGARRGRLIQQLFVEGMILGFAGGGLGIVLAPQIAATLIRAVSGRNNAFGLSPDPDLRIVAFNFGLALLVSVCFSLVPARHFWSPDVTPALKQQAVALAGGHNYLRRASVAAQIALSFVLLLGAGLFVRTLHNLKTLDVGFATDHLVTFNINPKLAGYGENQIVVVYRQILEKLQGLPGVRSVAATNDPELADNSGGSNVTVAGYRATENEDMNVEWERVSANYFSTLEIPILAGRAIEERDGSRTQKVAVVNESFAKRFFGMPQSAIGHYFCSGAGDVKPDIEIVGVVRDARHTGVRSSIHKTVFTPYLQGEQTGAVARFGMTFYVRTWQPPIAAEGTIRQGILALDSRLALAEFRTMQEQVDNNLNEERVLAFFATSFAVVAGLMAAIGIYGVLAYATAQRTREIGIRVALGASRTEVVRMVLLDVTWLAVIGIAIGLPLAFALTRVVRDQLFGISNYDPTTLCVVFSAIVALGVSAAAIPAYRAAKVDPMVALRYE